MTPSTQSSGIGPSSWGSIQAREMERLRSENERMEAALRHYRKPLVLGSGEHAAFLDVGGVARRVLDEIWEERP